MSDVLTDDFFFPFVPFLANEPVKGFPIAVVHL